MKKIIVIILVVIMLIPIGFWLMLEYGNPISMYLIEPKVEKDIVAYLENKGYTRNDLMEFRPYYGKPKIVGTYDPRFYVVFEDEPNVAYFYLKKYGGQIVQFCNAITHSETKQTISFAKNPKHLQEDCFRKS